MANAWLVVLTWNGRDDTLELLTSLEHAHLDGTTVLVVDNDSHDGTLEAVRAAHPWVETLQNGDNLGYAAGNNRGIEYALEHGAEVVGVLNNDTLVDPDFWAPLVTAAGSGMAVSPDIRYLDAPERSWFFGAVVDHRDGIPRHLQPHEQARRDVPHTSELLTGCCLVASATTWRTAGLFDEGLYLIFEDSDWSMRAGDRGVPMIVLPASRICHKVSRSLQSTAAGVVSYYYCRNGLVFAARWLGVLAALRFFVRSIVKPSASDVFHRRPRAFRKLALRLFGCTAAVVGRRGPAGCVVSRVSR